MQRSAFHTRHELDDAGVAHVLDQPVDDVVAEVAMGHLATLEAQRSLDLVAFLQEAHSLVLLGLVVVLVHRDRKLDFLDDDDFLLLAGSAVTLVFLVKIFAVILDTADRRNCVR